jgi:PAS domain S-box-containing protein
VFYLPASPLRDPRRLSALAQTEILNRAPEAIWDRLTRFGATVLRVPMTAITVITEDRQIVLSHQGIPDPLGTQRMTPVDSSFCHHVVRSTEPLIVDDTRMHPLVHDSPLIRDYGMLAYAGWPWRTPDGQVQGTFCAMDVLARNWTPAEIRILQDLAGMVTETVAFCPPGARGGSWNRPEAEMLLNQSLVGVCVLQDGRIRYVNGRLAEILGYSEPELLGLAEASSLIVDADRLQVLQRSRRRLDGALPGASDTFRCRRKDGQIVWVEMQVSRAIVESTPSVIGVVTDVTNWKRAEESFREGEDRLRLLVRATNDFTWEWDIPTGRLQWDEAAPRVLRHEPDEMGPSFEWWAERIHAEDLGPVTSSLNSLLNGSGNLWTAEYRFRRGDGSDATLLNRGYIARSARGVPLRMTCAMIDVSERRKAEDAQRFLAQISTLLAASLEPDFTLSWLIDPIVPSLADFCVIQLLGENGFPPQVACGHLVPAKAEFLKHEVADASGEDLLHPLLGQAIRTREAMLIPNFAADDWRRLNVPPAERRRLRQLEPTALLVVPLFFRGTLLGAIACGMGESGRHLDPMDLMLAKDLAHRIAMAMGDARLYAEAQQAIKIREEIINMVSHDLRNPLSTIQMASALLRDVAPERREENRNWLDVIGRSADRMNGIIQDLLDLSRIDSGGFAVEPSESETGALLSDVRESLEPLALQKQIRLEVAGGEQPMMIFADLRQLQRVFSNLVGNALKFTPEGGSVEVRAEAAGDHVIFNVRDTGPGIHQDELPHVFERYWQARTNDRRGVGLGLSIARGIVEAHGGRIWAESTPGEGATFYFTVPGRSPGAARPIGEGEGDAAMATQAN